LARDPVGIKPLYVLYTHEGLFFASQYDQILAHPWAARLSASPDALGLYLRLGYVPAPYGLMKGTMMLEPGTWLEVTADGRRARGRYYAFPVYQEPDLRGDEAHEAVAAAVTSAVRRRMASEVPLGAFLSGGVGSTLVAATAASAADTPLKAFTIDSGDDPADESADAQVYAQRLGLHHVVEHDPPNKAIQWLDRIIDACGEPMADASIFPMMLASCLARSEVTVVLSGDGGDALFWGNAGRIGPVLAQSEAFRRPRWLRGGQRAMLRLLRSGGDHAALGQATVGEWYRGMQTRLVEPVLKTVFNDFPSWPDEFKLFEYGGWRQDETAQWLRRNDINGALAQSLLKVDRAGMFHSLEVRIPLLDREVLDIAARVDWRSCLDLGEKVGKLPLRRALSKHVEFRGEPKCAFSAPVADWLRGPLLPVFQDSVLGRMEVMGLPLKRKALMGLLNDHVAGRADHSPWLWSLLLLSLWAERYLER
jgi:asparagine synthase (glutamine-hydrolysing)